jgi:hypothetical protein
MLYMTVVGTLNDIDLTPFCSYLIPDCMGRKTAFKLKYYTSKRSPLNEKIITIKLKRQNDNNFLGYS